MCPVHRVWPKPSCKAQWKGGRRQGRQRKRWEDDIRGKWTGLEFGRSQRAVENRKKWRKLVAKSSVVPQRPSRLRDRWWWWWWWWYISFTYRPVEPFLCSMSDLKAISKHKYQKRNVIVIFVNSTTTFFKIQLCQWTEDCRCASWPQTSTVGGQIASPDLKLSAQPTAKLLPSLSHSY